MKMILIFKSAHSDNATIYGVSQLQCTHTALVTHKRILSCALKSKCSCSIDPGEETNSKSTGPLQEKLWTWLLAFHPETFHNVLFLLTVRPRAMDLKLEWTLESPKPFAIMYPGAQHSEIWTQEISSGGQVFTCIYALYKILILK